MSLFYNPTQGRMRAAWRLILLAILFFVPALLLGDFVIPFLARAWNRTALPYLSAINGLLLLAFILLACWLAARFFDRRPFRDFGLHFRRAWWRDFVFGLALGAVLMLAIFLAELAAGWLTVKDFLAVYVPGISPAGALLVGAIGFICVGICEELSFRGYLMRNLAEGLQCRFISPRAALLLAYLLSSLIFGLMHQGRESAGPLTTPFLALIGLFFGLSYLLTGDLAVPVGIHITWNFFQGYVFGFPVSGASHEAALVAIRQGGQDVWTGGAWGPEGGLVGVLALLVGAAAIIAWVRLTRGALRPADHLALYQPPAPISASPTPRTPAMPQPGQAEQFVKARLTPR